MVKVAIGPASLLLLAALAQLVEQGATARLGVSLEPVEQRVDQVAVASGGPSRPAACGRANTLRSASRSA